MARLKHYHVYVIELSKDVLLEGRFKRCNPGYVPGRPCVYVGMTGLDPDRVYREAMRWWSRTHRAESPHSPL